METKDNEYGLRILKLVCIYNALFKRAFHLEYNSFHNT